MFKWILTKIVGSKNQRELKKLRPLVAQILAVETEWMQEDRDREFLISKTKEWQTYLHRFLPLQLPPKRIIEAASQEELDRVASILNERFEALRPDFPKAPKVDSTPESIEVGKAFWHSLEETFMDMREEYLNEILPQAFAVAKIGARQLLDTTRSICGMPITWNMVHFDVQLIGGITLHKGYISEMATGEGKTLVGTLPVYLNALTGMGVHVVTVNDYLARRDSEWMGMLFEHLGLSVGCIQSMMPSAQRRLQYACDITYGTNAEFGFDYLRDNGMASSIAEQVQRGHYYAIVDEVDSILIDEARTPLIISGPAVITRDQQYDTLRPLIETVVKAQGQLCSELMEQAREHATAGRTEEAGRCLFKVKLGQPRNRDFMRAMQEPEFRRMIEKYELLLYADARKKELFRLKDELFFVVEEKTHDADLMEKGRELIAPGRPDDFVLPDLGTAFAEMDENPNITEEDKAKRKKELYQRLDVTGARLHTTAQLLKAYCIYEKDQEYVISNGKVVIVDQNTGREMPGRRWSDGLHQAVEAKEGVEIERENQTYATITIQNYFRLYMKLAGMTGTAETEAAEFHDIYRLDVLPIPTNRPCVRGDKNDLIFKSRREKFNAVVLKIQELNDKGQPILVGTASVEASETLSRMLKRAKIVHEVLNAKNHQREAEIIALAGQRGAVTVATNMAGRGTDIKLGEGVDALGGLFVLGTERHESRRIDRQLRGRCARQGDPGNSQFFISFEDDLMRNFGAAERMTKMMETLGVADGEALEHRFLSKSVESAQKRVEQRNYIWRKHVLDYDDVMNQQREVVYGYRNEVLSTENPRDLIYETLTDVVTDKTMQCMTKGEDGIIAPDELLAWANSTFPLGLMPDTVEWDNMEPDAVAEDLSGRIRKTYELKAAGERAEHLDHMERQIILSAIDKLWQEHLYNMDGLREGVRLRAQGQKDPLVEYKAEAYELFVSLMGNIKTESMNNLFRSTTNLDAFEDFLASLGNFTNLDESGDSAEETNLGDAPADLLAALRQQMSGIRAQQEQSPAVAQQPSTANALHTTVEPEPGFIRPEAGESLSASSSLGVVLPKTPGKKIVIPKRKITFQMKKTTEGPAPVADPNAEAVESAGTTDLSSLQGR